MPVIGALISFFADYLRQQRAVSSCTVAAYRDYAFKLMRCIEETCVLPQFASSSVAVNTTDFTRRRGALLLPPPRPLLRHRD
jgi:hypothetical protein